MTHKLFSILLLLTIICSCQSETQDPLHGIWVGGELQIDEKDFFPLQSIIELTDNKAVITSLPKMEKDTIAFYILNDSLHVDTMVYAKNKFNLKDEKLAYRPPYWISSIKASSRNPGLNRVKVRNKLRGLSWNLGENSFHFQEDQKVLFQENENSPAETYCWRIYDKNELIFLGIQGNHLDCENGAFPIFQITNIGDKKVDVRYIKKGQIREESMRRVDHSGEVVMAKFQLCNRHLNLNNPGHHYYYKGTELVGGHYKIKKKLASEFTPKEGGFTGIVRVRFIVNCEGKTGKFEVESFDNEYKKVINPDYEVNQLLSVTQNLEPWIPGKFTTDNPTPIDTYIFIGYKLKDGNVVDILP